MICNKCKIEKPKEEFPTDRCRKMGRSTICKQCKKKYILEWRKKSKTYADYKIKNSEKEKQRKHDCYLKYKESNEYKNRNRINGIKRRSHKISVNEIILIDDIEFIKNQFENKCFNCGSTINLEIDHYYPLSLGHKLSRDNGILLCKKCNTIKNNKLPQHFFSPSQILVLEVFYNKTNGSLNDIIGMHCVVCGNEMNYHRPLKKPICSHKCRLKYNAEKQREYIKTHPRKYKYNKTRAQRHYLKHRENILRKRCERYQIKKLSA